jgi:hypothetical protein
MLDEIQTNADERGCMYPSEKQSINAIKKSIKSFQDKQAAEQLRKQASQMVQSLTKEDKKPLY